MTSHPQGFRCTQFGACCRSYIPVTRKDIMRWAVEGRDDILAQVSTREMFIHPVPRDVEARCPFLRELPHRDRDVRLCDIHGTKPEACRGFPTSQEQAERMGCPGVAGGAEEQ